MSCVTQPTVALLARPAITGSLGKPVLRTLVSNLSVFALGLVSSILLNRGLGPEGKGLYATLLTTSQLIVMLASLGLGKSVTFYLSNREEKPQTVFGILLSLTFLTVGLALVAVFAIKVLSNRSGVYEGSALCGLAALSILSIVNASGVGVLRGLKQFGACNVQGIFTSAIFLAAVLVLVFAGSLSPMLAVFCKVFSFLTGLIWIWPKLKGLGFLFKPRFESALARKMLSYGLGFFFYALFQNLSYRFDLILVAHLTSLTDAGWYSTASGLAEIIWYFPNAVGLVLFPVIAGLNDQERDRLVGKTCRWSILVMAVGITGLVIVAPVLIPLLYGNQFLPTVNALYSLSFGILTNGMFQILGIHLAAKKRLGVLTLITASGFAVNLVLNLILIPRFGIVGAGLASTVSYSLCGFLTAYAFSRTTGMKWSELLFIPREEFATQTRALFRKLRLRTDANSR